MPHTTVDENLKKIWRYYDRGESRIGYRLLLGGTKHFGYYEPGDATWNFHAAMRRMEDKLAEKLTPPHHTKPYGRCGSLTPAAESAT